MVTIVKGEGENRKTLQVARSAYKNFYKSAGWQIDEDVKIVTSQEPDEDDEWAGYGDDGEKDEPTKPLSEMSRAELEERAKKLGVDLTGLSSTRQMREAIKAAM